jgi:ABC-type polysaccharide/polyol phosphate export permease
MVPKIVRDYREIARRRTLVHHLAEGNLRASVHRTALGTGWFLLQPIIQIAVYFFLFTVVFRLGAGEGAATLQRIAIGILHYGILYQAASAAASAIHGSSTLMLQIKIDPLVLVSAAYLRAARMTLVGVAVSLVVYLLLGPVWSWKMLAYPAALLALYWLAWSMAIFLAPAVVYARDLERLVPVLLQMIMYLSPVIYSPELFPPRVNDWLMLNPVAAIFGVLQWSLRAEPLPPTHALIALPFTLIALFVLAHMFLAWSEKNLTKSF